MPDGLEPRAELADGPVDVRLATLAPRVEQAGQLPEALGLEDLEREVLQLPLDLPDPEALGQRRVDLHRLAGDAELLLGRQPVQGPHVVEPVGELDEDDPDVLRHRQQHLADVLGLLLLVAVRGEARQLGHAIDEVGHLGAEPLLDVAEAVLGVLGHVVEERGLDGVGIDAEVGHDLGRGDRVRHVRLAGRALLALVRLDREIERAVDVAELGGRVVLGDRGHERRTKRVEVDLARGTGPDGRRPARTAAGRRLRRGLGRRRRRGRGRRVARGRRGALRARRGGARGGGLVLRSCGHGPQG